MPRELGRICTQCGARLTAPCDGADKNCFRNKTIKPKGVKRKLLWIPVLLVLGLLAFACGPDQYEQVEPMVCTDRDTGYVIIFNRWAHLPDDTMAVEREKGTFYEVSCQEYYLPLQKTYSTQRVLLPITAPVLKYWEDSSAAKKFEHCK